MTHERYKAIRAELRSVESLGEIRAMLMDQELRDYHRPEVAPLIQQAISRLRRPPRKGARYTISGAQLGWTKRPQIKALVQILVVKSESRSFTDQDAMSWMEEEYDKLHTSTSVRKLWQHWKGEHSEGLMRNGVLIKVASA